MFRVYNQTASYVPVESITFAPYETKFFEEEDITERFRALEKLGLLVISEGEPLDDEATPKDTGDEIPAPAQESQPESIDKEMEPEETSKAPAPKTTKRGGK